MTRLPDFPLLRNVSQAAERAVRAALVTAGDLTRDTRAGVAVLLAVSLLALATATGVALDFARGLNFKTGLQGAIDSAALAGATEYLNTGSATQAATVARNYVNTAIAALPPNNGVSTNVATAISGSNYNVTVTASGSINTSFVGVLEPRLPVSVTATATAAAAPNINFYLLLDASPSMAIAATQQGIDTMVANTPTQCSPSSSGSTAACGCGFGCHESNPSTPSPPSPGTTERYCTTSEIANNQNCTLIGTGNPGGEDNYQLAQNLGVTLRIDLVREAVENLMAKAQSTENFNKAQYQMAIYTFDKYFHTIQSLTSDMDMAKSEAGNISMPIVYTNNWYSSSDNDSDTDTNYTLAMTDINGQMPNPGNGTNAAGDTPQEFMILVTDGVEDELVNGSRVEAAMDPSYCTTIKNRGIKIAVLYTEYLPLPTNPWYVNHVAPFQDQIASNLQQCASASNLYVQVGVGGDISAALATIFSAALQTAHLTR